MSLRPAALVDTVGLFPPLHARLMELIEGLREEEWDRPTRAGSWTVRDVAAHLLDGDLRKLSFHRDGHTPPAPAAAIEGYGDLLAFLNGLNHEWVNVVRRRWSARLLLDLLRWSGPQVSAFVAGLDPRGEALFPVAWAGEARSENWMDTAREYTERWHHQQQVREAVEAPLLEQPEFLRPVIEASVRALPWAYGAVDAQEGATVTLRVEGEAGGAWTIRREDDRWALYEGAPEAPTASVTMNAGRAWRLFFKALPEHERGAAGTNSGDARLAAAMASTLAVMA